MTGCRLYRVAGKVQGVWFRESTRQQAVSLGVSGYAANLADGTVEVLACGDEAALARLEAWLRRGPPLARVKSLDSEEYTGDCPGGFSTR